MALNLHNVMVASLPAGRRLLPLHCLLRWKMVCRVTLDFLCLVFFFVSHSSVFVPCDGESTHSKQKSLSKLDGAYRVFASGLAGLSLRARGSLWSHCTTRIPLQRNNGKENFDEWKTGSQTSATERESMYWREQFFLYCICKHGDCFYEEKFQDLYSLYFKFLSNFYKRNGFIQANSNEKKNVVLQRSIYYFCSTTSLKKKKQNKKSTD